ncbi:hypothetical protein SAMN05414137_110201 [Streptacidiphilus jiangxiensis]|uniref:Uncharacterized protein n=1 Tax=Streptacidiphilus jiangxiensis TaxID=235985 RepID=A0A1H7RM62_STRJI|nr:hypothetical protein SAMN05414137_110201 [Streptacidiphilus jiangxiensis]
MLVQTAAWAAATGAAVSVSWFGVHRVLADDGYQQPSALGLTVAGSVSLSPAPLPTTIGTATQLPQSPTATPTHRPTPGHSRSTTPSPSSTPSADATGNVRSYTPPGGRIVVSMGATSAELVSATPNSGWGMHVYTGDQWLRVDFTQGSTDSIFYVTWNGHPPMVQTWPPQ